MFILQRKLHLTFTNQCDSRKSVILIKSINGVLFFNSMAYVTYGLASFNDFQYNI